MALPAPKPIVEKTLALLAEKDSYRLLDGVYILKSRTAGTVIDCSLDTSVAYVWSSAENPNQRKHDLV